MIKNFNGFLKESHEHELHYYCFDWDDNILHMSTVIHMDKLINGKWTPTDVSTAEFAQVRNDKENWRILNNNPTEAFSEFRDTGPRGSNSFLEDTKKAISDEDFGPSWDAFVNCLSSGSIFGIITARGHEPNTIKKSVEYIIDSVLTENEQFNMYSNCLKFSYIFGSDHDSYDRVPKGDISKTKLIQDYLSKCEYFGVSAESFVKRFGLGDASNPEKAKEIAVKFFVDKVHKFGEKIGAKSVSVGFSDDDIKNVDHIEKLFKNELSLKYVMKYNIYDTSKRNIKGGVRRRIVNEGSSSWGVGASTWGTAGSVLPFTKWNNMTQTLYPSGENRQDDSYNGYKNKLNMAKDLYREFGYKRKKKK